MSRTPKRPLRYRGLNKRTRIPLITTVTLAVFLTYLTAWMVVSPVQGNIPGRLILDVIFVSLAVWVDRIAVRRAREVAAIDAIFVYLAACFQRLRQVFATDTSA